MTRDSVPGRSPVGRSKHELPTPALLLDHEILEGNIRAMAEWSRDHAAVRPHTKAHKSPEIARLQIEAGAIGVTAATAWEVLALVGADISSVLLANEVADPQIAELLAVAAGRANILVAVDSSVGARILSSAAATAGSRFEIVLEVDVGMTRGGVRSPDEAVLLAREVGRLPGLDLVGVMGWEGHVATERVRRIRAENATAAVARLLEVVDALEATGVEAAVVSAGGTNTYDLTGSHPRVTEIQAGTYALMDTSYEPMAPAFRPALTVLGTVVSRHEGRAVLDCGSKVQATTELAPPRLLAGGATVLELHEEHALLDIDEPDGLSVGERAEVVVSYAAGTVNLHDSYLVCVGDSVVDVWPIVARGPGGADRARG